MNLHEPCPDPSVHGNPFRYCPYCDWMEETPPTPVDPDLEIIHKALTDLEPIDDPDLIHWWQQWGGDKALDAVRRLRNG